MKIAVPRLQLKEPAISWRFVFIVVLTLLTLYIDLPKLPLEFNLFGQKYDITLNHPTINWGNFKRDLEPRLGLDLQGGTQVVLDADMSKVDPAKRQEALQLSRTVIERRVNLYGVSEPVIQTAKNGDNYRIIVELAGIKNISDAVKLIGQTAKLEFRKLPARLNASQSAQALTNLSIANTEPTGLDGGDIESASPQFQQDTNAPTVGFRIRRESQDKFFQTTSSLVGQRMIIFLDEYPVSAPTVQQGIRESGVITGQFTTQETKQLALQLNAGALKAPVKIVGQRNVGATLGNESINKSIIAGTIGLTIIAIFMVANYGRLGLIANLALLVYTLVTFAIFKLIPITFTLAGIAGFILSIGMAVDANILIFERMKEEMRWGKDYQAALRLGFDRAMSSIKASNISTLITTLILYWFGTGIVRGFALTLAIGVLVSMFSAIYVSRTLLRVFYKGT